MSQSIAIRRFSCFRNGNFQSQGRITHRSSSWVWWSAIESTSSPKFTSIDHEIGEAVGWIVIKNLWWTTFTHWKKISNSVLGYHTLWAKTTKINAPQSPPVCSLNTAQHMVTNSVSLPHCHWRWIVVPSHPYEAVKRMT